MLCELILDEVEDIRDWLPQNKVFNFNDSIRHNSQGRSINGMAIIKSEWIGGRTTSISENIMMIRFEKFAIISVYITNKTKHSPII